MTDAELLAALTDPCLRAAVERIIAEREQARAKAADYFWEWAEEDDDPEDWQRCAYRSDNPEWLQPPQWFIEKHPWMRTSDEHP